MEAAEREVAGEQLKPPRAPEAWQSWAIAQMTMASTVITCRVPVVAMEPKLEAAVAVVATGAADQAQPIRFPMALPVQVAAGHHLLQQASPAQQPMPPEFAQEQG
jgi:hypothetical protein